MSFLSLRNPGFVGSLSVAGGGAGGMTTYLGKRGYNQYGVYNPQGVSINSINQLVMFPSGWNSFPSQFVGYTSGQTFAMSIEGTYYPGTLTSGFTDPYGMGFYQANFAWDGAGPDLSVSFTASPEYVAFNGIPYYSKRSWVPAGVFDAGAYVSSTIVRINSGSPGGWPSPGWTNINDFNAVLAQPFGATIQAVYRGVTYTGTITSAWSQPYSGSSPEIWETNVTWDSTAGLLAYIDYVESIAITPV